MVCARNAQTFSVECIHDPSLSAFSSSQRKTHYHRSQRRKGRCRRQSNPMSKHTTITVQIVETVVRRQYNPMFKHAQTRTKRDDIHITLLKTLHLSAPNAVFFLYSLKVSFSFPLRFILKYFFIYHKYTQTDHL